VTDETDMQVGVAIPVRAFALGKARLAEHISAGTRAELARRWAAQVATAASDFPIVVVTSDDEVREWARGLHCAVVDDPGSLDDAAAAGRAWARERGLRRVVVAHADLPRATTLRPVARDGAQPVVALVPCHRDDGTPVLSVPVDLPFRFAYGPGSFRRHAVEARRVGAGLRVVRDSGLAFDVDLPEDLAAIDALVTR
jgi:2-phospho-L-lactate guanylyltransferase